MSEHNNSHLPSDVCINDVLLRKYNDSHVEIMSFCNHIGNRRFQIYLDMHRTSYNQALLRNDLKECERISGDIAHSICHCCNPKGRFLEQEVNVNSNNIQKWCNLGEQDDALVRERIRRGFLGLLFTIPVDTRPVSDSSSSAQRFEKKKIQVNLADKRFVIKDIAPPLPLVKPQVEENLNDNKENETSITSDIDDDTFDKIVSKEINYDISTRKMSSLLSKTIVKTDAYYVYDDESDISDSDSDNDTFDEIVSNEISYDISTRFIPTMVSNPIHARNNVHDDNDDQSDISDSDTFDKIVTKEINYDIALIQQTQASITVSMSQIQNDDILFFGENANIIFDFDHVGNNRLRQLVTLKSKSSNFAKETIEQFVDYARELVQGTLRAYPNTRFLKQKNQTGIDLWVPMDIATAILKMSTSIFCAARFFSCETSMYKTSSANKQKRLKIGGPQASVYGVSSDNSGSVPVKPNTQRSKAA